MNSKRSRFAKSEYRAVAAAFLSVLLASCTSTTDPTMTGVMPGFNATGADLALASSDQTAFSSESTSGIGQTPSAGNGEAALPEQVAFTPVTRPGSELSIATPAAAEEIAGQTPQELATPGEPESQQAAAQAVQAKTETASLTPAEAAENAEFYVTATEPEIQAPAAPKKKSFLAAFFGSSPAQAAPAARQPAKPIITLASVESTKPVLASATPVHAYSEDSLPGVRKTALFEITRKSGTDDDSDVDLNEDEGFGSYKVASAAGLARLAPNGLLKQTERVDVACLKPSLVRVLKQIERHYGKKMVVTSGYRDPKRNRRARGAKNSLHMYCAAADIQVPGVGKWELANYVRSMPGRGGVGTYCHTASIHVDVGPERDWNWRCRRRKK